MSELWLLSDAQMRRIEPYFPLSHGIPRVDDRRIVSGMEQGGITPCIPSKTNRKLPIPHDTDLYRQRHKVENMFGKLKDWRRIHTRYARCAHTFMSAICIAAIVIFWLPQ